MRKPIDVLREIEENYKVEEVRVNELKVWQILRRYFVEEYENEQARIESSLESSSAYKESVINKVITKLSNAAWNRSKINSKHRYILFTDRLEERAVDGYISDKIAHNIIKIFGEDILLVINQLNLKHRNIKEYGYSQKISSTLFELKRHLSSVELKIENEDVLIDILREYKIEVNYNKILEDFFKYVDVLDKFIRKKKPELIFVNCYYILTHQALIYSAHKNNVRVVELQHGIINSNHYAYNIYKNIGRDTFADYLFVFGDYFKNIVSENYIDKRKMYSIGNFYIENSLKESLDDESLKEYFNSLRKDYSKIVVVTSQEPVEKRLVEFIKQCAKCDDSILYIFIPRYYNKDFSKYGFPSNIIINKNIDFYHSVGYCDYHSTVYSTCALESLCFGVPNILININDLSKDNLLSMLEEDRFNVYVEDPNEFVSLVKNNVVDLNAVKNKGQQFYLNNNKENIKNAIQSIKSNI